MLGKYLPLRDDDTEKYVSLEAGLNQFLPLLLFLTASSLPPDHSAPLQMESTCREFSPCFEEQCCTIRKWKTSGNEVQQHLILNRSDDQNTPGVIYLFIYFWSRF